MSNAEFIVNEITSYEDIRQLDLAKRVGEALNDKYPCHLWLVCWQGGALVVKNLALGSHYGFVLPDNENLERNAMLAGGELLERARMRRGAWDGSLPNQLDGADPKIWKPIDWMQ